MKTKKNQKNKFKKILFLNLFFLFFMLSSGLFIIEFIFRAKNPYSLFPEIMTQKKSVYKGNYNIKFYDGGENKLAYEPKTNVTYKHNYLGFRVNKNVDNDISLNTNSLNQSTISFGDSTSYGLNIENKETFIQIVGEGLSKTNKFNFSYPGMNLESITYKINCTNKLLGDSFNKAELSIISLYYNDIEDLGQLNDILDPNKCKNIKQINLLNASFYSDVVEKGLLDDQIIFNKDNIKKFFNFNKYPLYIDMVLCRKIFIRTCPMIKFSISNIHPKLKSKVFGSNQTNDLYAGLNKKDKKILEYNIENFKKSLLNLSKNSNQIILFYIPRDELDLININNIKGRERVFLLFNQICRNPNLPNNLNCLDGGKIIYNNLNQREKNNLFSQGRLPSRYYSYLKFFDMGHPSKYVSKMYAQAILNLFHQN